VLIQVQDAVLPFSVTLQKMLGTEHVEQSLLTVTCNGTWPFVVTVGLAGVTPTTTLLGLNEFPPPPQPEMTISRATEPGKRVLDKLIGASGTIRVLEFAGP
jgi:hypothetical protein